MHARGEYGPSLKTRMGVAPSSPFEGVQKQPAPPHPTVWLLTAAVGAATANKKHRVLGFIGGGVIGVLVDEVLRHVSP